MAGRALDRVDAFKAENAIVLENEIRRVEIDDQTICIRDWEITIRIDLNISRCVSREKSHYDRRCIS